MKQPFFPHPPEFNLGYKSSERTERKEKTRRWFLAHKLKVMMLSTLLVLPLTVNIGLWDIHSFEFGPGTYSCGSSYVHFDGGSGWFFNGEYFIPMTWNENAYTYEAAGAYPKAGNYGGNNAEYILAKAGGDMEITRDGIILLDPFTQQKQLYRETEASFNSSAVDAYNRNGAKLYGHWKGKVIPSLGYPVAFPINIYISDGDHTVINVTNTFDGHVQPYEGVCSISD
ncbi:MAG: hypothetical protein IJI05_02255, partial [Erysipelotrichaceae bacterium]|nr:hypothetical protein [Erysipelotrichaceae bacterium]